MKIAISTDIYYPMINGVAVFSRNLAAGLSKRGHQVMVLAPSTDGKFKIEKDPEHNFLIARLSSTRIHVYPDQINKVPEAKKILGVKLPKMFYKNGLNVSLNPYTEIRQVLDDFAPDIFMIKRRVRSRFRFSAMPRNMTFRSFRPTTPIRTI